MRVMIVDDEEDFRVIFADILKNYGFEVVTAVNGMDCLDKLGRIPVDLVLMDLFMPVMSGLEAIKTIRRNDSLKNTKIAIVTVMDIDDKSYDYLREKLGVADVILKPVEIGDLIYRIGRIMKSKNPPAQPN